MSLTNQTNITEKIQDNINFDSTTSESAPEQSNIEEQKIISNEEDRNRECMESSTLKENEHPPSIIKHFPAEKENQILTKLSLDSQETHVIQASLSTMPLSKNARRRRMRKLKAMEALRIKQAGTIPSNEAALETFNQGLNQIKSILANHSNKPKLENDVRENNCSEDLVKKTNENEESSLKLNEPNKSGHNLELIQEDCEEQLIFSDCSDVDVLDICYNSDIEGDSSSMQETKNKSEVCTGEVANPYTIPPDVFQAITQTLKSQTTGNDMLLFKKKRKLSGAQKRKLKKLKATESLLVQQGIGPHNEDKLKSVRQEINDICFLHGRSPENLILEQQGISGGNTQTLETSKEEINQIVATETDHLNPSEVKVENESSQNSFNYQELLKSFIQNQLQIPGSSLEAISLNFDSSVTPEVGKKKRKYMAQRPLRIKGSISKFQVKNRFTSFKGVEHKFEKQTNSGKRFRSSSNSSRMRRSRFESLEERDFRSNSYRRSEFSADSPRKRDRRSFSPRENLRSYSPTKDIRSCSPRRDFRSFPPEGDHRSFSPRRNFRSYSPRGDFRGVSPRGDFRAVSPRGDFRELPPRGDFRGVSPRGDFRGVSPRGDFRGVSPRGDIRGVSPRGDFRAVSPRGDFRELPPREDFRAVSPRGDFRRVSPRGDFRRVSPRGDFRAVSPRGDFRAVSPRGDFRELPPRGDFRAESPRGDFRELPPRGDFRELPPRGDFRAVSPRGDFRELPPRGDFRAVSPRGEFRALPPRGDFRAVSPRGDFRAVSQRGDFRALPPRGDFRALSPREDFRELPPRGEFSPLSPRDKFRSLHPGEDWRSTTTRDDFRSLPPREDFRALPPREDFRRDYRSLSPREDYRRYNQITDAHNLQNREYNFQNNEFAHRPHRTSLSPERESQSASVQRLEQSILDMRSMSVSPGSFEWNSEDSLNGFCLNQLNEQDEKSYPSGYNQESKYRQQNFENQNSTHGNSVPYEQEGRRDVDFQVNFRPNKNTPSSSRERNSYDTRMHEHNISHSSLQESSNNQPNYSGQQSNDKQERSNEIDRNRNSCRPDGELPRSRRQSRYSPPTRSPCNANFERDRNEPMRNSDAIKPFTKTDSNQCSRPVQDHDSRFKKNLDQPRERNSKDYNKKRKRNRRWNNEQPSASLSTESKPFRYFKVISDSQIGSTPHSKCNNDDVSDNSLSVQRNVPSWENSNHSLIPPSLESRDKYFPDPSFSPSSITVSSNRESNQRSSSRFEDNFPFDKNRPSLDERRPSGWKQYTTQPNYPPDNANASTHLDDTPFPQKDQSQFDLPPNRNFPFKKETSSERPENPYKSDTNFARNPFFTNASSNKKFRSLMSKVDSVTEGSEVCDTEFRRSFNNPRDVDWRQFQFADVIPSSRCDNVSTHTDNLYSYDKNPRAINNPHPEAWKEPPPRKTNPNKCPQDKPENENYSSEGYGSRKRRRFSPVEHPIRPVHNEQTPSQSSRGFSGEDNKRRRLNSSQGYERSHSEGSFQPKPTSSGFWARGKRP